MLKAGNAAKSVTDPDSIPERGAPTPKEKRYSEAKILCLLLIHIAPFHNHQKRHGFLSGCNFQCVSEHGKGIRRKSVSARRFAYFLTCTCLHGLLCLAVYHECKYDRAEFNIKKQSSFAMRPFGCENLPGDRRTSIGINVTFIVVIELNAQTSMLVSSVPMPFPETS